MLEPNDRSQLFEALRPPEGFELDRAIGTTYSLDLMAMLIAPVSFTSFDWALDGGLANDPLALLESVRRSAEKISVYCQAGHIAAPAKAHPLFTHIEDSIVEVNAEVEGGVFHPKVWVLRFASEDEIRYRFLCLTRNLTFDRCWDTALILEGPLQQNRSKGFARNRPLGDFVARLPHLAIRPASTRVLKDTELIADEIRRVDFAHPEPLELVAFHPMGIEGYKKTRPVTDDAPRLLIVAPFVSAGFLKQFSDTRDSKRPNVLVSRVESLSALEPSALAAFQDVRVMSSMAEPEPADEEVESVEPGVQSHLSGLHAKLFVSDEGWDARLWTGSANASEAAFARNVEFLVELKGRKSVCGIDSLLSSGDTEIGFGKLLDSFRPAEEPSDEVLARQQLIDDLDRVRDAAVAWRPRLDVRPEDEGTHSVRLSFEGEFDSQVLNGVSASVRIATLPQTSALSLPSESDLELVWGRIAVENLTPFLTFELRASREGFTETIRFVVKALLEGAPVDRRDRVMRSMLKNKSDVLRLLLMILAEGGADFALGMLLQSRAVTSSVSNSTQVVAVPLLESLVKALDRDPQALDRIGRLVADLGATEEGRALLPDGFADIWEPITLARAELLSKGAAR